MKNIYKDKVAAITGAGSGIGAALAYELASLGAHLSLSDVNTTGLQQTQQQLQNQFPQCKVFITTLDVNQESQMNDWAKETVNYFGQVHYIFNNAGVAQATAAYDIQTADFKWIMDINFWGVIYGTQAFLPYFFNQKEGNVVNISSLFGLIAQPTQATYNASKFAVRGYTEALIIELKALNNGIKAFCVHPGGVKTNIAKSAQITDGASKAGIGAKQTELFEKILRLPPQKAAQIILNNVQKGNVRILVGYDAWGLDKLQRVCPKGANTLFSWVYRRLV